MDKAELLKQLLEGVTGTPAPSARKKETEMSEKEMIAHNIIQTKKYADNIRSIPDADLVRYLVCAENALVKIINSDPSLTATNHNLLINALKVLSATLEGTPIKD